MKINCNYSILLIPLFILGAVFAALASPRSYALEADVANANNNLFPNNFNVDDNDSNDINNSGIMLLNNNEPSVSLTIGGAGSSSEVIAQPGSGTVYSNHTITIGTANGENILNYALTIAAPANLSGSNGGALTGAGGKTGNSMSDNTWGYYYNKDGTTAESAFGTSTFNSLTGTAQTLESGSGAPSTTSKSLVLAAKFGSESTNTTTGVEAGHYRGTINLSLVATPKTLYTYSITYNVNGGTASSNPAKFTTTDYNDSLTTTISSTTPTRANYTFLGWSKSSTATSATYSANGSITLNASNGREITLYAIWRRTFTLTLNDNSGTGGPGTQTCDIYNSTTSCSITISSTKPTRANYDFQGWGANSTTTTVSYNPGDSISMTADKAIYAVWKRKVTFTGITQMQQMTSAICSAASIGDSATLIDSRDSKSYSVRKLADGKCWMTQNLTLDLSVVSIATVSESDNLSANYPSTALPDRFDTDSLDNRWRGTASNSYMEEFAKAPRHLADGFEGDGQGYQTIYGYYYSWCAVTAGSCTKVSASSIDAPSSICPKGWKMPTLDNYKNLTALYGGKQIATNKRVLIGASTEMNGGAYFSAAGYIGFNGLIHGGTHGDYWTSTAFLMDNSISISVQELQFYLLNSSTEVITTNVLARYDGAPVRCIAK